MKYVHKPDAAPAYLRFMELYDEGSKAIPEEVFRWTAWATGIAAIRIVREQTDAVWLTPFWIALLLILVLRIQWFTLRKLRHPEVVHQDGSVEVTFTAPRLLIALAVSAASWWFVFALPNAITEAGLISGKARKMEVAERVQVAPRALPRPSLPHQPPAPPVQ